MRRGGRGLNRGGGGHNIEANPPIDKGQRQGASGGRGRNMAKELPPGESGGRNPNGKGAAADTVTAVASDERAGGIRALVDGGTRSHVFLPPVSQARSLV